MLLPETNLKVCAWGPGVCILLIYLFTLLFFLSVPGKRGHPAFQLNPQMTPRWGFLEHLPCSAFHSVTARPSGASVVWPPPSTCVLWGL